MAKANTRAATTGGLRSAEQRRHSLGVDARSLIRDAEQNAIADITHAEDHLATLGRKVDRVQQQVRQDLQGGARIPHERVTRILRVDQDVHGTPLGLRSYTERSSRKHRACGALLVLTLGDLGADSGA